MSDSGKRDSDKVIGYVVGHHTRRWRSVSNETHEGIDFQQAIAKGGEMAARDNEVVHVWALRNELCYNRQLDRYWTSTAAELVAMCMVGAYLVKGETELSSY